MVRQLLSTTEKRMWSLSKDVKQLHYIFFFRKHLRMLVLKLICMRNMLALISELHCYFKFPYYWRFNLKAIEGSLSFLRGDL